MKRLNFYLLNKDSCDAVDPQMAFENLAVIGWKSQAGSCSLCAPNWILRASALHSSGKIISLPAGVNICYLNPQSCPGPCFVQGYSLNHFLYSVKSLQTYYYLACVSPGRSVGISKETEEHEILVRGWWSGFVGISCLGRKWVFLLHSPFRESLPCPLPPPPEGVMYSVSSGNAAVNICIYFSSSF